MARGPLGSRRSTLPSHRRPPRVVARRRAEAARGLLPAWASRNPPSPGRASSPRPGRGHTASSSRSSLSSEVAAPIPAKPCRPSRPGTESRARSPHGCGRSSERKELAGRGLLPLSAKGRAQAPPHAPLYFRQALPSYSISHSLVSFLKKFAIMDA